MLINQTWHVPSLPAAVGVVGCPVWGDNAITTTVPAAPQIGKPGAGAFARVDIAGLNGEIRRVPPRGSPT